MFAQPVRYTTLDGKWSDVFTITDPESGESLDVTGFMAKMIFTSDRRSVRDYGCRLPCSVIASTDTGEIINNGTDGTLGVTVALHPGIYKVRGEISLASYFAAPFFNGQLTLSRDGWAQIALNPLNYSQVLWNDGGVVAIIGKIPGLPTILPSVPGQFWDNGGVLSLSDDGSSVLTNTLPALPGLPWNNSGVVSIS